MRIVTSSSRVALLSSSTTKVCHGPARSPAGESWTVAPSSGGGAAALPRGGSCANAVPAARTMKSAGRKVILRKYISYGIRRCPTSGFQCGEQFRRFERLAEAGSESGAAELFLGPAVQVGGHRDDRRVGGADRLGDREAVEVGQDQVEQDEVELARGARADGLSSGGGRGDAVAGSLDQILEELEAVGRVLDDQEVHGPGDVRFAAADFHVDAAAERLPEHGGASGGIDDRDLHFAFVDEGEQLADEAAQRIVDPARVLYVANQ